MNGMRRRLLGLVFALCTVLTAGPSREAAAQARPEGEMRWALYVTLSPQWFDPAEVIGFITPFWVMYGLHDAVVKPMPGNHLTPSLAESWTVSPDGRVYEFKLRPGLKFYNGDPFTAEDVKFSFHRAKGAKVLQAMVSEDERVRFAPLYDYVWPSAVSTRVEEPALMLIDPYPWSALLEDVRLRKR